MSDTIQAPIGSTPEVAVRELIDYAELKGLIGVEDRTFAANALIDALQLEPIYIAPFIAAPMIAVLLIIMFISTSRRGRRRRGGAQQ